GDSIATRYDVVLSVLFAVVIVFFFFSSRRRHTRCYRDSSSDVCSSDLAKLRPSGHDISENFSRDNGAAIPPNLIAIPNTESNSRSEERRVGKECRYRWWT